MRPALKPAAVAAALIALAAAVAALGRRQNHEPDRDPRRSTFLAGPAGARGFAEALGRLGVTVEPLRRSPRDLGPETAAGDSTLLALLGATEPLELDEGIALARLSERGVDLLLAGRGAEAAMRCFGYSVLRRWTPVYAVEPGRPSERPGLRVNAVLIPTKERVLRDSSEMGGVVVTSCVVPAPIQIDTLLRAGDKWVAAMRLTLTRNRRVTIVADDALFSNRSVRATAAGPFVLRLVRGRYRRVLVDEYHHGFAASGSLRRALWDWSLRSPWGWAGWQLVLVGLIALLAAAVRFGPVRSVIQRRRRSPLEHVRALATALAAARGHALASGLLVQGLRRRLGGGPRGRMGRAPRGDSRPWLASLAGRVHSSGGQAAVAELLTLTQGPQRAEDVLRVAELVEDVWNDLKP